jgi:peptide/nickel transport system permease protein
MNWITKRIGQALFTAYVVITLTFVLIRYLPGGPMEFMRARLMEQSSGTISQQRLNAMVQAYTNVNPDKPVWQQYVDYMVAIVQGDFGKSIWYNEPVMEVLLGALPWTLFVTSSALIITFIGGIMIGATLAYFENSRLDVVGSSVATFLNSIPFFIMGIILLWLFAYLLNLFPPTGRMNQSAPPGFNVAFIGGILYHATLPIAAQVITETGGWALSMRGNSIRVLGEDYLRVARLRGLSSAHITNSYVARNAILPMYTSLMIGIGFLFGGSVILETIFSYPGMGWYIFRAINARDHQLMMGAFLLITLTVIVAIFVADLTYGFLDPTVGQENEREAY